MDIPIDAKIVCQDGDCGHICCVIINPVTDELTYVVVEEDNDPNKKHIVPVKLLQMKKPDILQISCSKEAFLKMDDFIEHRFIRADKVYGLLPATKHVYLPYGWPLGEDFVDIKSERIPPGELAIYRGTVVQAVDGEIGKVDQFLVDPPSGLITHLIIRESRIWGEKEISIPISEVDQVDNNIVYLKLKKAEVGALPTIPLHHWF